MDEAPGGPGRDRGFKARKREDHALVLIESLKKDLRDLAEVRRILRELGRYYDPVPGGAIMEVDHQRAIVEALESGRQAEALAVVEQRYELASGQLAPLFWGGLVVAGLVVPLLVDLVGLKLSGAVPAALVLVGGFILRYVIVMANA